MKKILFLFLLILGSGAFFYEKGYLAFPLIDEYFHKSGPASQPIPELRPALDDRNSPVFLRRRLFELLQQKRYEELNAQLEAYQTAFEKDVRQEKDSVVAYSSFELPDISFEPLFN